MSHNGYGIIAAHGEIVKAPGLYNLDGRQVLVGDDNMYCFINSTICQPPGRLTQEEVDRLAPPLDIFEGT